MYLLTFPRVPSLALGQSYDCTSEVKLKYIGKNNYHETLMKSKKGRTVYIILGKYSTLAILMLHSMEHLALPLPYDQSNAHASLDTAPPTIAKK